jgi:hypothetical protein
MSNKYRENRSKPDLILIGPINMKLRIFLQIWDLDHLFFFYVFIISHHYEWILRLIIVL